MIGSFLKTTGLVGLLFSVSTVSTVAISKQLNKKPIPNSEEPIEEEYEEYDDNEEEDFPVKILTDTEHFINHLTSFGNLSAELDASIEFNNVKCNIDGTVFVSLETLEDLSLGFDLNLGVEAYKVNLKGTYVDDTVFIEAGENKLKLETNKVSEIIDLIDSFGISLDLPDEFKNIDTDVLLNNLGSMESTKDDSQITYKCNLINGIPPIIFTSDLSYNMTSVSLKNAELMGVKLNVNGHTNVLGKGHNKIVNPETETNKFLDISCYFGVVKQIQELIDLKKFGISYTLSTSKNESELITSVGKFNIDLNDLKASIDASLKYDNHVFDVTAHYLDKKIYFNYNNLLKLSYSKDRISDLINVLQDNLGDKIPSIDELIDKLGVKATPLFKIINEGNYLKLLDYFDGLEINKNSIVLKIDNSLLGDNEESTIITVNLEQNRLKSLTISNLVALNISFDLSFNLESFEDIEVQNLNEYSNADDINYVVDDVFNLIAQHKYNVAYSIETTKDENEFISATGDLSIDLDNTEASINGEFNIKDLSFDISTIYKNERVYLDYNNLIKLSYSKTRIIDLIDVLKKNLGEKIPSLEELIDKLGVKATPLFEIINNGNYLDLLDYFDGLEINENSIILKINNSLISNNTQTTKIVVNLEQNHVKSLTISDLEASNIFFNLSFKLNEFTPIEIQDVDSYSDVDNINGVVDDVFSLIKQDKFALSLDGSIGTESGITSFSGTTQFDIDSQCGFGHIAITDKNLNTHNVDIDVYDNSQLYFSYNKNLNGHLTVQSILDIFGTLMALMDQGNQRVEKYLSSILEDFSNTLIKKIIDGDYLAIVKNNIIKSFNVVGNTYNVSLAGELIGSENPINLSIITTNDNKLSGISLSINALGFNVNLNADLCTWSDSYSHLDISKISFYDFSELSVLVDFLLTTATCNDFSLSGSVAINLKLIKIINKEFDLDFDVKVHIDENENVVSCLTLSNIPHISSLAQSEDWDERTFEIYISDDFINLRTISETTKLVFSDWKFKHKTTTVIEEVHLTHQQMIDNLVYYLVDFGLGIDKVDLSSAISEEEHDIDYSKIISNYKFSQTNNVPSWNIGVNLEELAGNDMLETLNATITGDANTHLLSSLSASTTMQIISIIDISLTMSATLQSTAYIGDAALNKIISFGTKCSSYTTTEIHRTSSSVIN